MIKNWRYALTLSLLFILINGCSGSSETEEFNKPALYWYKKIAQSISSNTIEQADNYYISLKSEHIRSPLMPTAMEMMAYAHTSKEEYQLCNFYLDEYNKFYGIKEKQEYITFLKIKSSFLGVKEVYKDQKLIQDTISLAEEYLNRYLDSKYTVLVGTMLTRLQMTQYLLNENIASLYHRTDKENASKIYLNKNKKSVIKKEDIQDPKLGIVAEILE